MRPMSEAAAVRVLARGASFRTRERVEVGWLPAGLERRFGCNWEEWAAELDVAEAVGRALARDIQQQVREGKIMAQAAMKFPRPAARVEPRVLPANGREPARRVPIF